MLTARTLAEARTYLGLLAAAGPAPEVPGPPPAEISEGAEAWTVRTEYGEVEVPYVSEDAARTAGSLFGLGVSQLVDAAQWVLVATTYARRALDADFAYTGQPGEDRDAVELNWEFAGAAMGEALKFLPEDGGELPDSAFWSELGTQARDQEPARFTRVKLVDDHDYYRGTLDDFRALYGPRA